MTKSITTLHKRKKKSNTIYCLKAFVILFISLCIYTYFHFLKKIFNEDGLKSPSGEFNQFTNASFPRPPACTAEQKSKILEQLTPTKCNKKYEPYNQKCSLTKATKCPSQNWINSYYEDLKKVNDSSSQFIAVYVGCNKGYDAVNAIRMGTRNQKYSKSSWHSALKETFGSVCNQNESEFPISPNDIVGEGIVHCIEPMPTTAQKLLSSAKILGWEQNFLVTQAAISNKNGEAFFEVSNNLIGQENKGLGTCELAARINPEEFKKYCRKVDVFTLDYYMENVNKKRNGFIDLLSIDVEGFDFDVMLGGRETLSKTKYMEFEYNWMGSWEKQKLIDAIRMLDSHEFTCYWAGVERLWRIDESCWLDHYDWHVWSNVACVNRNLNPDLAERMEKIFQETLQQTGVEY